VARRPQPLRHCPGIQSSSIVLASRWAACCCLTSRPSGRLRRRLTQALGSRAFFFCYFIVCITFWLRAALLRASLRFCFSHARSFLASRAHWLISHLRARSHARFLATPLSSPAVRSWRAGHNRFGIARHTKQQYRVGQPLGSLLLSNISSKRTAPPPLNSSVRWQSVFLFHLSRGSRFGFA
jgi:hypothetical protein